MGDKGLVPISAEDEGNGSITYIKDPFKSLIDHIYLSPNLARQYGPRDFFIVASDRTVPNYIEQISDHRPVLARLSLGQPEGKRAHRKAGRSFPPSLREAWRVLYGKSHRQRRGKRGPTSDSWDENEKNQSLETTDGQKIIAFARGFASETPPPPLRHQTGCRAGRSRRDAGEACDRARGKARGVAALGRHREVAQRRVGAVPDHAILGLP
jgi:hypothetical protein